MLLSEKYSLEVSILCVLKYCKSVHSTKLIRKLNPHAKSWFLVELLLFNFLFLISVYLHIKLKVELKDIESIDKESANKQRAKKNG